ncbi:hypothetical protein [Diatraea saccharalis granulovirus]|uniref:Uncharacterized protein n=1 Tax=Diatraea saccharalis granulovirus TaxID=1675862 RepID=A0A0R7EYW7_9BBAC|nr:hypothetical protein [Diatraea saccharalis granulovirus]AKN80776.1 hypothetical protein [Diatraea saccharalis granulovirus]
MGSTLEEIVALVDRSSEPFKCPPSMFSTSLHFLCKVLNAYKAEKKEDYNESARLLRDVFTGVKRKCRYSNEFNIMYNEEKCGLIKQKRHTFCTLDDVSERKIRRWGKSYTPPLPLPPTPKKRIVDLLSFDESRDNSPILFFTSGIDDFPLETPRMPSPLDINKLFSIEEEEKSEEKIEEKIEEEKKIEEEDEEEEEEEDKKKVKKFSMKLRKRTLPKGIAFYMLGDELTCRWGNLSYLRNKLKGHDIAIFFRDNNKGTDFNALWESAKTHIVKKLDKSVKKTRRMIDVKNEKEWEVIKDILIKKFCNMQVESLFKNK